MEKTLKKILGGNIARKKNRRTIVQRIVLGAVFAIFAVYSLTLVYPFYWALINSFKSNLLFFRDSFGFPTEWIFKNWLTAFTEIKITGNNPLAPATNLFGMFGNSLWLSVGGSLIAIASSTMAAYVVSKYEFKGKSIVYSIAIFIMIIPIVGNLPATYKLYSQLGLRNSPFILLAYTGGFGFNFIILYAYYKNISWYYAEAAFIDGASNLKVFLHVMLPQTVPCLASLFIIQTIGIWNDYMTPLLYLDNYATLSSGIYVFGTQMTEKQSNFPVYFAGILLSTIPILVLFICFSQTVMENTVAGGLKG